ncbi:uncharacterized protein V6R79_015230 [Siganus canaliculatus]
MLRLLRTSAFCFWCFLLLHRQAVAVEEAVWEPTPSIEKTPEKKTSSSWWSLSLPSLPSFPSLSSFPSMSSLPIPGFGRPKTNVKTDSGLTEPIDAGSGQESISETSEPPTTSTQGFLTSVTDRGPESLPTGTSDSPRSSIAPRHNDTLVSDSYSPTSSPIRNTPFINSPASTNVPEQHATHTRPPRGTAPAAGPSMGATTQQLPEELTEKQEAVDFTKRISSTIAPETTVPTALTWADAKTTTTLPGLVETTLTSTNPHTASETMFTRHGMKSHAKDATATALELVATTVTSRYPHTSTEATFVKNLQHTTFSVTLRAKEATMTETLPTQRESNAQPSSTRVDPNLVPESIASTTPSQRVDFSTAGELPAGKEDKKDEEESAAPSADGDGDATWADISTPSTELLTPPLLQTTVVAQETPHFAPYTEDWMSSLTDGDITFLPDCNKERSGICNLSDTWDSTTPFAVNPTQNTSGSNQSINPFLMPAPLMLVPLYTDWNSAMADWGLAWEAHVYGAGGAFAVLTLASALNLLCLPLRCPSGCGYFALVSLFLLAAGCTRSFSLLYDAYGHQDRLPSTEASLMLYEAPFPCLTAAFGLVFLLLSMRSRMQLSYSAFQRPCFLACLVFLHFAAAFGPVTLLKFYQQKPPLCLFLSLLSRGAFVALATFLSVAYFVFYVYVRADSKHIYHLNNTSPTPAERYNRCPFAESRDWDRAAVTVCLSALFSLACAGLQLYAILNAMGVVGGAEVFQPWPWWAFQFSCRLCELGVCLTLALVVAQPVYCSDHLPDAGSCWTELLASKSPILPGSYQWSLSQQEKLAIVDTVGLGETESLPLYTLMDERLGSSLNGLDLLYHSNRALAYRDLDLDLDLQGSGKPGDGGGEEPSGGSSFTSDSTTDLRPPSPINLRRSIDEALFSDSLFPMSLFSSARPLGCSDLSINNHCALPSNGLCDPLSADPGLYRTSSCAEITSKPQPSYCQTQTQGDPVVGAPPSPSLSSSSSCSSPEHWRGSSSSCSLYRASLGGSSLVLCPTPERQAHQAFQQGGSTHVLSTSPHGYADPQRHYQTLGAASQESLDLDISSEADRSVQEEFISVCRQIDALSVCSETIDL